MGLTNLLFYLREVILQDSALLQEQFPSSPVWNHPVFQHEMYVPFARQVRAFVEEEKRPSQLILLTQALPVLTDFLKTMDARNEARIRELGTSVSEQLNESIGLIQASQSSQLQQLLSHGIKLQLEAPPSLPSVQARAPAPASFLLPPPPPRVTQIATESHYTSAQSSPRSSEQPSPTPAPPQQLWEQEDPPAYRMCRATKTVEGLWREWTVGLRGQPSITALDGRWGSRWRANRPSELQWYSLRLEAIKEIRRTAQAQRISEEAAMLLVNLQQRQIGCSLDRFCKQLRQGRKMSMAARKAS